MQEPPRANWKLLVYVSVAFIFGAVFVYAGMLKAIDPGRFLLSIRSYRLLPDPFAAWLALSLPWLEVFAGLAVMTGWLRRGGLLLLNMLLVVFAAALIISLVRGLDVECGCFGGQGSTAVWDALVRDAVLLFVGLWLWYFDRNKKPKPTAPLPTVVTAS